MQLKIIINLLLFIQQQYLEFCTITLTTEQATYNYKTNSLQITQRDCKKGRKNRWYILSYYKMEPIEEI